MTTIRWDMCGTEVSVLKHIVYVTELAAFSKETMLDEVIPEALIRMAEIRNADGAKTKAGIKQPPREPKAEAAVIEVVERGVEQSELGVVKPNELRINGVPILVPRDNFIEVEGLEYSPDDMQTNGLIVKVRMYARRVLIGEPR